MDIRGLIKSSFNEWEGRISAVVFTAHCNWRCPYCHGAALVLEPDSLPPIPVEEVMAFVKERGDWIDGIAITGGEPTLQPDLPEFIREIKKKLPVKLETNGTNPQVIKHLLDEKLLDCLCLDYKAPLDDALLGLTSVPESVAAIDKVSESYKLARSVAGDIEVEFHTTLCPTFIDVETIRRMASQLDCPNGLWVMQQYEIDVEMLDKPVAGSDRFSHEQLADLEAAAKEFHQKTLLRKGK